MVNMGYKPMSMYVYACRFTMDLCMHGMFVCGEYRKKIVTALNSIVRAFNTSVQCEREILVFFLVEWMWISVSNSQSRILVFDIFGRHETTCYIER